MEPSFSDARKTPLRLKGRNVAVVSGNAIPRFARHARALVAGVIASIAGPGTRTASRIVHSG